MRYLVSSFIREEKKIAFEIYVTDALKGLLTNTSAFAPEGVIINERYAKLINPETQEDIEEAKEKASEIIERIKKGVNAL